MPQLSAELKRRTPSTAAKGHQRSHRLPARAVSQGRTGRDLIRQRAAFIDTLLGILWDRQDWGESELALVAVGGYGRGELHPHSDVDLLILLGENCDDCSDELSGFLTLLWDIGLDIGHSVRDVRSVSSRPRRHHCTDQPDGGTRHPRPGDADAAGARADRPDKMWPSQDFFRAKLEEQRARHAKFADTEYNLEPNVKSSPGGLRDLQIIGWIAERHFGVESLEEITAEEFLNPDEMEILSTGGISCGRYATRCT